MRHIPYGPQSPDIGGYAEPTPPQPFLHLSNSLRTQGNQSLLEIAGSVEKPDLTYPGRRADRRFQRGMPSAFSTDLRTLNSFSMAPM